MRESERLPRSDLGLRRSRPGTGRFRDWFPEGKERDCHRKAFRKREELLRRTFLGARYAASTVGSEQEQVRQYIREQDAADGSEQF